MNFQIALWAGIGLLLMATATGALTDSNGTKSALVDSQRHYHATLTLPSANALQVIATARELDYWIRIQTGSDITYLKGMQPCTECNPSQEASFFTPPRLYVDGQRFWIHLQQPGWELHLRPQSAANQMQYELVASPALPKTELSEEDLSAIGEALAPFAILPAAMDAIELAPLNAPEKAEPPSGVRIDSVLFGLIGAPDWNDYAAANQIELSGMRAVVVIELGSADAQLPEGLDLVIESRSTNFVRAQVLIYRLAEVASNPAVAFVRLPSAPQPPVL